MIQTFWLKDIVVDDFDLQATFRCRRQILDELPQFRSAYSVCTIDGDWPIELPSPCRSFECRSYFLIVSLLGRFTIFIRRAFGVQTACDVMKLWCGKHFVVGILGTRRLKSCKKGRNEARSRGSSVSCKHHSCFNLRLDVQIARELIVGFQQSLVGGRVGKCCSVCFPRTLRPLSEGLTAFGRLCVHAIPQASRPIAHPAQISQYTRLPHTMPTMGSTNLTPLSSGGL